MKKITDIPQLIYDCLMGIIIVLLFCFPFFVSPNGRTFSIVVLLSYQSINGILFFSFCLICLIVSLIMSFMQSLLIHKKSLFCLTKEFVAVLVSISIMFYFYLINNYLVNFNFLLKTKNFWLLNSIMITYPIFFYLVDYIDGIFNAE